MYAYDIIYIFYVSETFKQDLTIYAGSNIEAPFKYSIRRIIRSPYTNCLKISLGSIVIPAMFIRFLRVYDNRTRRTSASTNYFGVAMAAYTVSLMIWTASHAVFRNVYPDLVIMVPIILTAVFIYSIFKRDLVKLWSWRYEKLSTEQATAAGHAYNEDVSYYDGPVGGDDQKDDGDIYADGNSEHRDDDRPKDNRYVELGGDKEGPRKE